LIPTLVQTVTKANAQSNQSQLVSEAVTAACLLVKLSLVDIQAGMYITQVYVLTIIIICW